MEINGKEIRIVSIDVSTSDKDADHRIFARPLELQENSDGTYTLLCEKTEDNYEIIKKLKEDKFKHDYYVVKCGCQYFQDFNHKIYMGEPRIFRTAKTYDTVFKSKDADYIWLESPGYGMIVTGNTKLYGNGSICVNVKDKNLKKIEYNDTGWELTVKEFISSNC